MLVLAIDTSSRRRHARRSWTSPAALDSSPDRGAAARVTLNARGHGELLAPSIAGLPGRGWHPGRRPGRRRRRPRTRPVHRAARRAGHGCGSRRHARHPRLRRLLARRDRAACAGEAELLVATDARRNEVYWARYRRTACASASPQVARPADIDLDGSPPLAGAGARGYDSTHGAPARTRVRRRLPARRQRSPRSPPTRILAGAPGEALTPLYLRRPDAVANPTSKPVSQ